MEINEVDHDEEVLEELIFIYTDKKVALGIKFVLQNNDYPSSDCLASVPTTWRI